MAAISSLIGIAALGLGAATAVSSRRANAQAVRSQREDNARAVAQQEAAQAENTTRATEAAKLKAKRTTDGAKVKLGSDDLKPTKTTTAGASRGKSKRKTTTGLSAVLGSAGTNIGGL